MTTILETLRKTGEELRDKGARLKFEAGHLPYGARRDLCFSLAAELINAGNEFDAQVAHATDEADSVIVVRLRWFPSGRQLPLVLDKDTTIQSMLDDIGVTIGNVVYVNDLRLPIVTRLDEYPLKHNDLVMIADS